MIYSQQKIISRFFIANKLLIIGTFLSILVSNVLRVIIPLSIGWFYEIAFHEHGPKSRLLQLIPLQISSLRLFFIVLGCLILVKTIVSFAEKFLSGVTGESFSRDLRELTFRQQMHQSLPVNRIRPAGKYLLRYSGDLMAIQRFISKGVLAFVGDLIFLICTFAILFHFHSTMGFIIIAWYAIGAMLIYLISIRLRKAATERRDQRSINLGFISSRMHAFYTIKSFNRENPEEKSFTNRSEKLYKTGVKYLSLNAGVHALVPFVFFSALATVLYYSISLRETKPYGITKGDMLSFILLLLYMQGVLTRLLKVNVIWQMGSISFTKLLTLLQFPTEERNRDQVSTEINGKIEFKNVCFSYGESNQLIQHASFVILANSITLVKGKSGSGKSTLFKLIQKIYEPTSGEILMDNIPYTQFSPFALRKEITIVSEEAKLLGKTIMKAISYSDTPEKRIKAREILQKLRFRLAKKDNMDLLDFSLEDGAQNLSSGEKLTLQFARALLTRKKIILLDDCFKNIDDTIKNELIEILNKLKNKRTILLISNEVPEGLLVDQIIKL